MKKLLVLAVAALVMIATPVMAKEGFYVGAYFVPSSDVSGISNVESGSGYGFRAGFGFNRYLSIEGSYDILEHDMAGGATVDIKGWSVDAKVNFPLTSLDRNNVMTLEPFVRAGYGIDYEFKPSGGGSDSGSGLRLGVGIELYLFKELSVSAGWTRTAIELDKSNEDGSIRAFDIGLNYHFM